MALDAKQRRAIEQLAAGATITAAAKVAGVDRATLSKWVNHDPEFAQDLDRVNTAVSVAVMRNFALLYAVAFEGLEDLLKSDDEAVRMRAVAFVLERGPAARLTGDVGDTSPATPEELDAIYERLTSERAKKTG